MERLTFKNGDGIACVRDDQCYEEQGGHYCGSAIDRLADYEDLGMLAEEIVDAVQQDTAQFDPMQALQIVAALDLLNKYQQAEKDGRLVVLPCKVGDTVYFDLFGKIIEKQVFSIVSFSNSTRIYCDGTSEHFRPEDVGKTFFLTREEAEAALEAEQDG